MSRPRRVSNDAILDAVIAEMVERGPHLSLAAVAERVEVSETVLFQRFGSRAGMLDAAIARATPSGWAAVFDEAADPTRIADQLIRVGDALTELLGSMQMLANLLILAGVTAAEWMSREDIPTILGVRNRLEAWLSAAQLSGALPVTDPSLAASLFMGSIQLNAFEPLPPAARRAHVRKLVKTIFAIEAKPHEAGEDATAARAAPWAD